MHKSRDLEIAETEERYEQGMMIVAVCAFIAGIIMTCFIGWAANYS